jgi:hypothetical protein
MSEGTMKTADYIAIASVMASLTGAFITWLVMRRNFASKKLAYSFNIEPILRSSDPDLAEDLKVFYKDELLPSPALLNISIVNAGLSAVEDAKVIVNLPCTTYLLPGYFVDLPPGYSSLWTIERTDAEECTIQFKHINPNQVAHIRLLMDNTPTGAPTFSCAMPNVEFTKTKLVKAGPFAELLISHLAPHLLSLLR